MSYAQRQALRALMQAAIQAAAALKAAGYVVTANALTLAMLDVHDKFEELA